MKRVSKSPTLESDRKNFTFWLFGSYLAIALIKTANELKWSDSHINVTHTGFASGGLFSTCSYTSLEKHKNLSTSPSLIFIISVQNVDPK